MNNVFEAYKNRKNETKRILERLLDFLKRGEDFGVVADKDTIDKIQKSIEETENKKLKIVLIGGYKEGKTSIVSAWTGNYNEDEMNISPLESTYSINLYDLDDNYTIVDTPGLYGFKENEDKEKYKDITKKYISSADLIIYVMGSDNPIKESHKEDLIWMFKDLNLLPRTVFVLSRFDEEADIEDDESFNEVYEIKKESVKKRLVDFGIIDEQYEPVIVAVSAKPYEKKIQTWIDEDPEEYRRISHIQDLQDATLKIVDNYGDNNLIVIDKQQSIISDILYKSLPKLNEEMNLLTIETEKLSKLSLDAERELNTINRKIGNARINLKDFVIDYFTDLILQMKNQDKDTISDFYEREIGSDGIVIQTRIENEFEKQTEAISNDLYNLELSIDSGINRYSNTTDGLLMKGLKAGNDFLKNNKIVVNRDQVLAVRDVLFKNIKFKPWGAVKLATKITNGIAIFGCVLGIGLDVLDSYNEEKENKIVEQAKQEMISNFERQRKEYIDILNDDDLFYDQFFPSYREKSEYVNNLKNTVNDNFAYFSKFKDWKNEAESIDADFKVISLDTE